MPITQEMLDEMQGRVYLCEKPGEVEIHVGSNAATGYFEPKIAVNGRRYTAAGTIILKTGEKLRANLSLNTSTSKILVRGGTYCKVGTTWYGLDEPQLLEVLKVIAQDAFPFTWISDRPLDCLEAPPYSEISSFTTKSWWRRLFDR